MAKGAVCNASPTGRPGASPPGRERGGHAVLLFPADQLREEFRAASGGHDPNPQRLLQEMEFRDKWMRLGDKPSARAIKELRILAANIQGKKRRETPKTSLSKIPRMGQTPPEAAASTATKGSDNRSVFDEEELPFLEELYQALEDDDREKSYAEATGTGTTGIGASGRTTPSCCTSTLETRRGGR